MSEATSLEIRRFGLKSTRAKSRLELRRGQGPADLSRQVNGEWAEEAGTYNLVRRGIFTRRTSNHHS